MDDWKRDCPVCGRPRAGEELDCPDCGCACAYLTLFAGKKSRKLWEESIRTARKAFRETRLLPLLTAPGAFTVSWRGVSFLNTQTHVLTLFEAGKKPRTVEGVRQYAPGSHHALLLRTDGTVEARGNNDYGQCVVGDLKHITCVAAGPWCTLAVGEGGKVIVRGSCPFPKLDHWQGMVKVVCGSNHVVGLKEDGRVYFSGTSQAPGPFRPPAPCYMEGPVVDVAAAADYALLLHQDGTVTFVGSKHDFRRNAMQWQNVQAIAADSQYPLGLAKDGSVLFIGAKQFSALVDGGRIEARGWTNMAAIACGDGCIGGITQEGELRLAGSIYGKEELLRLWHI